MTNRFGGHSSASSHQPLTLDLNSPCSSPSVAFVSSSPQLKSINSDMLTGCGFGRHRPAWLKRFTNRHCILFWLCLFCVVQGGVVNGLVPSVLSTLEKRFDFSASTLGRISQFYDIGYVLCCVPVAYFGGRHSKPMFLGIGVFILALGSFTFAMPHFIASTSRFDTAAARHLSNADNSLDSCVPNASTVRSADHCASLADLAGDDTYTYLPAFVRGNEFLFCVAHLLHGVGATPLFTLGVAYIDENVSATLCPLYVGVFYTCAIFGPAFGFLLSAFFLRFDTDFLNANDPQLDNLQPQYATEMEDPNWIGAWWVSFLLSSLIAFIAVVPILAFPKQLPDSDRKSVNVATEGQQSIEMLSSPETPSEIGVNSVPMEDDKLLSLSKTTKVKNVPQRLQILRDIRGLPIALSHLLFNRCFVFVSLAGAIDGIAITGLSTFMAKYLERQFSLPAPKTNMIIGSLMVPLAGIGPLLSGYVVKRFELDVRKTLRLCIFVCLAALLLSPMFLIYCDSMPLAGVNMLFTSENSSVLSNNTSYLSPSLVLPCNEHCACSDAMFQPICGSHPSTGDPVAFYNPCFAGCPGVHLPDASEFSNCSCLPPGVSALRGLCESQCSSLFVFLAFFGPMVFFTFSLGVPALSVTLRCVDESERALALGIQWILIRCIGTIPAPALFGYLFDVACLKRNKPECSDSEGQCLLYDSGNLAYIFVLLSFVCQAVTLLFLILAVYSLRRTDAVEHNQKEKE